MIPILDLKAQYESIKDEINPAIAEVLESTRFILGPNVAAFEEEVAEYLGVGYAVGVASGTDALLLTLRAYGIGPGDEVIVPTYTFFATAEAVSLLGATSTFVDIEPETYCIDVRGIEERITQRTKAIIPVHLYGHPADMDPVLALARKGDLKVIEDNAQAFGAEYKGQKTGSLGDVGCLSFYPSKHLAAYGDGGMVVTNDAQVAAQVRLLRTHGWRRKYYSDTIGYNSRLDELQAAVLRVKLRHVDSWNDRRREIAQAYRKQLTELGVLVPSEASYARHVYHLYVVRVQRRAELQERLQAMGIASAIYYPVPLHLAGAYAQLGHRPGAFPEAERAAEETLALPMYPEMSDEQLAYVVAALRQAPGTVSQGQSAQDSAVESVSDRIGMSL